MFSQELSINAWSSSLNFNWWIRSNAKIADKAADSFFVYVVLTVMHFSVSWGSFIACEIGQKIEQPRLSGNMWMCGVTCFKALLDWYFKLC